MPNVILIMSDSRRHQNSEPVGNDHIVFDETDESLPTGPSQSSATAKEVHLSVWTWKGVSVSTEDFEKKQSIVKFL